MMPILSRWGSADIRHNIAQERQGRLGHMPCNGVILVRALTYLTQRPLKGRFM
jgi:hypothetical protein